ncbi:MAG TPA: hypothetical protein VN025_13385 [Candidatus Dormibacteraeota bacterium]|jgi:hypothetical protein|nr:hypothetical protein [Candidatus Dormibacteraeota bacterium]
MKTKSLTPDSASTPHCTHRTPSGRFCRLPVAEPRTSLCFRHAFDRKRQTDAADIASALTGDCDDFQTAAGIHHSLSELYRLLAEDRISPRRAAVLAYISNLLLRTLPAVHQELDPSLNDSHTISIDFGDLPRPNRNAVAAKPSEPTKNDTLETVPA